MNIFFSILFKIFIETVFLSGRVLDLRLTRHLNFCLVPIQPSKSSDMAEKSLGI